MGREIRRVPPDWQHPRNALGHYEPLHDRSYEAALAEWTEGKRKWDAGEDPHRAQHPKSTWEAWSGAAPNPDYYRPDWPAESATAFQVYETVSEGTPVSPVLATHDDLIHWLVNDGSGMGIGGVRQPMSREAAERFANAAWAPSMILTPGKGVRSGLAIHEE